MIFFSKASINALKAILVFAFLLLFLQHDASAITVTNNTPVTAYCSNGGKAIPPNQTVSCVLPTQIGLPRVDDISNPRYYDKYDLVQKMGVVTWGRAASPGMAFEDYDFSETDTVVINNYNQVCTQQAPVALGCQPQTCNLPWGGTLANGGSITAYASSSVPYGSTCSSQTRTCTNGVLSGSYGAQSCSVAAPANCKDQSLSWGTSNFCSATASGGVSGTSRPLSNGVTGGSGSATAICKNGTWEIQGGSSCNASMVGATGISATDGTIIGKVGVTWNAVAGASGYDVQYRKVGTTTWTTVSNVTSGWEHVTTDESKFEYQVQAKNPVGTSPWSASEQGYIAQSCKNESLKWGASNFCSATASAGVAGTSRPLSNGVTGGSGSATAICKNGTWEIQGGSSCSASMVGATGISATDGTIIGKVGVTWNAVAGASGYDLQYRKVGTTTWTTVANVTSGWEYETTNREKFEFQVRGKNVLGAGTWSGIDTGFISQQCQPATLNWGTSNFCSASVGVTEPGVSLGINNGSAGATGSATAMCDSQTGKWVVSNGNCSVNLPSAPVSDFKATQGTLAAKIQTTWNTQNGASGYDVQYRLIGTSNWTVMPSVSTGWILPTDNVTDYEFQLRGKNVLGEGQWSAAVTGWIQRCAAIEQKWGVASLCAATPSVIATGKQLTLSSITNGATGTVNASCVAGNWSLSGGSCVVAMDLDATDGTREDDVAMSWSSSIAGMSGLNYEIYRGADKIASGLTELTALDVPPMRGLEYEYTVKALLNNEVVGQAKDPGHIPACRAARLIGASMNADMSAINGMIEQWDCLDSVEGKTGYDSGAKTATDLAGSKIYKSFKVVIPADMPDGDHILNLNLDSVGVVINKNRDYNVDFVLDRASIAVKEMKIIYGSSDATEGLTADSVGRFGIKLEGGNGIGFAEEVR